MQGKDEAIRILRAQLTVERNRVSDNECAHRSAIVDGERQIKGLKSLLENSRLAKREVISDYCDYCESKMSELEIKQEKLRLSGVQSQSLRKEIKALDDENSQLQKKYDDISERVIPLLCLPLISSALMWGGVVIRCFRVSTVTSPARDFSPKRRAEEEMRGVLCSHASTDIVRHRS